MFCELHTNEVDAWAQKKLQSNCLLEIMLI